MPNGLITAHTFSPTVISASTNPLVADTYYVCTAAGATTQTLPAATGSGKVIILENTGAGTISLARAGSDTINGATSVSISPYGSVKVRDVASGSWLLQAPITNAAQTFAGVKTFSAGAYMDDAAGQSILNHYEEGSKTDCTFNGGSSGNQLATGKTLKWTRVGNTVTLNFSVGAGVTTDASESGMQIRTLPTQLRPTTGKVISAPVLMDTTWKIGQILIFTSGIVAIAPVDGTTVGSGKVIRLPYDSATDGFSITYSLI